MIDQIGQRLDIALCDDRRDVLRALLSVFTTSRGFCIVGEGHSAEDALALAERHMPHVLVLDLQMAGGGLQAANTVYVGLPFVRSVILTSTDDEDVIASCLIAGAYDVLSKGLPAEEIRSRVRAVAAGEAVITPALAARLISVGRYAQPWYQQESSGNELDLITREQQVLSRLAQSLSPHEIGMDLSISARLVRTYCFNILTKVHSAELVGQL